MKYHKFLVTLVLLTAAVLMFLGVLSPPAANAGFRRLACGSFVSGSYLATITNENTGEIASRSLTFFFDHNMSVVDSVAGGDAADFSDQQGEWKCTGRREIAATTLGLSSPDSGVTRLDYVAAFAGQGAKAQKVKGTIKLNLFFNPTANSFSDDADLVQKFSFTGQRVTAD